MTLAPSPATGAADRVELGSAKYELGRKLNEIVTFSKTWEEVAERAARLFVTPPSSGAGAAGLDVERPDPWVDTRLVRFDPSVHFGQSYDGFDNFDNYRWEMHVPGAGSYAVWSSNDTGKRKRWSFYGGPDGVMSFENYATEADARRDAEDYALSIKTAGDMRLAQRDATIARHADDLERLRGDCDRQRTALQRIERWHGEFPKTGRYWRDPGPKDVDNEMSYAACFGSNGERDFMRGIARDALAQIARPSADHGAASDA